MGSEVGTPGSMVGLADGGMLGSGVGLKVVGRRVGTELGAMVLAAVGIAVVGRAVGGTLGGWVGPGVGVYVTRLTPTGPVMTAVPVQVVLPMQPSRIRYVCGSAPAGTVYCTCAHTSDPK